MEANAHSSEFNLDKILRKNIKKLKPYRCARDDYQDGLLLDANENLYGPPESLEEKSLPDLFTYPDPHQSALKKLYGEWRGVAPEQIFVGVGSDEAIDMVIRMVCVPGEDNILICPPTYGMYKVSAAVNDIGLVKVPLTDDSFQIQPKKMLEALNEKTKIIWICSPNNPTANDIEADKIKQVLESKFNGLVILDEAYVDFSPRGSLASWTKKYPNLVVLQTFSKSWGLAGVRCGVAISSPQVISFMDRMKAPYNMNVLTSSVVVKNLKKKEEMLKTVEEIKNEKKKVVAELEKIPHVVKVFPSSANFLLFRVKSHSKVEPA